MKWRSGVNKGSGWGCEAITWGNYIIRLERVRIGLQTKTNPRTYSNLHTLEPRFESMRIQCPDLPCSCRRKVDPETFLCGFRQSNDVLGEAVWVNPLSLSLDAHHCTRLKLNSWLIISQTESPTNIWYKNDYQYFLHNFMYIRDSALKLVIYISKTLVCTLGMKLHKPQWREVLPIFEKIISFPKILKQ